MLRIGEIRKHCRIPSFFDRGEKIFSEGKKYIKKVYSDLQDDLCYIRAEIQGSDLEPYETELVLDVSDPSDEQIEYYRCNCPAFSNYVGMCKHTVALALLHRQRGTQSGEPSEGKVAVTMGERLTSAGLAGILARYNAVFLNTQSGIHRGTMHLQPTLSFSRTSRDRRWSLSCEIGTEKMYVVKNQVALIHRVLTGRYYSYGKKLGLTHSREMFDERSQKLLDIIEGEVRAICPDVDTDAHEGTNQFRYLAIREERAERLMELYIGEQFRIVNGMYPTQEGNPDLSMTLKPEGSQGAQVTVSSVEELTGRAILLRDKVYLVTPEFRERVLPFLRAMRAVWERKGNVSAYLSQTDYRSFCGNILPLIRPFLRFTTENLDLTPYQPKKPEFLFYLGMDEQRALTLRPLVQYGAAQYSLLRSQEGAYREVEMESPVREAVSKYFPLGEGALLRCDDEEAIYRFLREGFEELRRFGEVLVEDSAKKAYVAPSPRVKVRVALEGGLIALDADVENMPQEEMDRLLNAYARKKKFYRLSSGEFLSLEDGGLAVLSELSEVLSDQNQPLRHAQIPAYRAQYVNALLTEPGSEVEVERTSDFKSLVRQVRDYRDGDYKVSSMLGTTLRGYQKTGFRWMCALADCGLGGILADDMGLGKTVQTIALLLHRQKNALIVCPASLVYNWASELERFAPTLHVEPVLGTATARKEVLAREADVYVTSYDLLRRDVALYEQRIFDCCILDEAQYVRNAQTKLAKAVKRLRSNTRFALTGTPIFNRLGDLWSIFDFLLPGYLYSYPKFQDRLEQPILEGEEQASKRLQRLTAPFVLRRRKGDVLKELPEKVESVQYVEMTQEQRLLYRAQEQQLRQSLQRADEGQFRRERIAFLAALTRLRQLCCTPELYLEDYKGGSGKVEACMELLKEAAESEHKVLVFSQFTTMLDALYAEAEKQKLRCLMLTGQNSKEQRRVMVQSFQEGHYDVFFISLKAGGTGLNLTAADRIIHFDPWWNAAAEDQATDRAHRIGQTRTVFVTKLVAKDTVEERIVALQQKKRELSDQIMESAEAGDGSFSRETLLSLLSDKN